MKKAILLIVLALFTPLGLNYVTAADVKAEIIQDIPATPVVTKTVSSTIQTPSGTTSSTTIETQSTWSYLLSNVLDIFKVVITTLVVTLACATMTAVAKKFNIEVSASQQQMVKDAATAAVSKAEAWATAHKDTPSSNDKMNYAVKALKVVAGTDIAKKYTDDQLSHFVEEAVYKLFNQTAPVIAAPATTAVTVEAPKADTVQVNAQPTA